MTGGGGGPISAAPLRRERLGGVLIEKVERGKGCAGGGAGRCSFARECERLEALFGSIGGCEPAAIDPG